nr:MAG TPA: Alginate and motility regulator [Bacteriophage sp.]
MSQKMGRPKVENPKDVRFSIRLDADTDKKLCEYCERNEITRATAIRTAIHRLLGKKK